MAAGTTAPRRPARGEGVKAGVCRARLRDQHGSPLVCTALTGAGLRATLLHMVLRWPPLSSEPAHGTLPEEWRDLLARLERIDPSGFVGGVEVWAHPGYGVGTWGVYPHGEFAVSGYSECLSAAPAAVRPVLEAFQRGYPWDQREGTRVNYGPAGQGKWSLWHTREDYAGVSGAFTARRTF